MKDLALQTARRAKDQKLNILREYLQNYILFLMQKQELNTALYFVGGTALRFLHRIRRFSEDLDFSAGHGWKKTDFAAPLKKMEAGLEMAGYAVSLHLKEEKTVQRAVVRFSGLLYELGLSPDKNQNLPIAIEVDTNPPAGWAGERTIIDVHWPVLLQHYDLPSLFATKIGAILTRPYMKGRDLYDLFWYRTKWRELLPNFFLLNNALAQMQKKALEVDKENWLIILKEKMMSLKWRNVQEDIRPFLESPDDLDAFTKENLILSLSG